MALVLCSVFAISNPTVNAFPMTPSKQWAISQQSNAIENIVNALNVSLYSLLYEAIQHQNTEVCYKFHTVSGVLTMHSAVLANNKANIAQLGQSGKRRTI